MRWPVHATESVRPSRFTPAFCPWPDCSAHFGPTSGFQRWGSYRTKDRPTRVPRFRCNACGKTCSRQTFSTTYYLKRAELLVAVASELAACSAHRQIARTRRCSKTTVTRMAERVSRHAILFHANCIASLGSLTEPVVHDHFESFIGRQDHALGIGTAVGAHSWFVYDIDPAPHRGSGRRPDRAEARSLRVHRPYVSSIRRTFHALLPKVSADHRLVCVVDARLDYRTAVQLETIRDRVRLKVYPNPKRGPKGAPRSPEAVARDLAMFPVDQLHQLLRHSCSDHKRETIAFGRRLESILGRAHLMAVWKNFIKARSERKPDRSTPAMRVGLAESPWPWERVFSRRLFPSRSVSPSSALKLYWKRWTPNLPALELRHAA